MYKKIISSSKYCHFLWHLLIKINYFNILLVIIKKIMGKTVYSRNPTNTKVARASGKDIRVHYKNTY